MKSRNEASYRSSWELRYENLTGFSASINLCWLWSTKLRARPSFQCKKAFLCMYLRALPGLQCSWDAWPSCRWTRRLGFFPRGTSPRWRSSWRPRRWPRPCTAPGSWCRSCCGLRRSFGQRTICWCLEVEYLREVLNKFKFVLTKLALSQAEILFHVIISRDAPPRGTWFRILYWFMAKKMKKAQRELNPRDFARVLYQCAVTTAHICEKLF